jgi:hypothetical protein
MRRKMSKVVPLRTVPDFPQIQAEAENVRPQGQMQTQLNCYYKVKR